MKNMVVADWMQFCFEILILRKIDYIKSSNSQLIFILNFHMDKVYCSDYSMSKSRIFIRDFSVLVSQNQCFENLFSITYESNAIGYHIRHLREKMYEAEPDAPFTIRCVREVGDCFEVSSE